MAPFRSVGTILIAFLALAGLTYYYYGFASAEKRLHQVCTQIQPGMSLPALTTFAADHGLGPTPRHDSGVIYLVESRTYGRYGCKIEMEAGAVKSVAYHYAD